jgi:Leucine-rich repeat (LRR) protein
VVGPAAVETTETREEMSGHVLVRDDAGNVDTKWAIQGDVVALQHGSNCFMGCTKYYYLHKGESVIHWRNRLNLLIVNGKIVGIDITRLSKLPRNLPKNTLEVAVCRHCRKLRLSVLRELGKIAAKRVVIVLEEFRGSYDQLRKLAVLGDKLYGVLFRDCEGVDLGHLPMSLKLSLLGVIDSSMTNSRARLDGGAIEILDLKGSSGYASVICSAKGLTQLRYARLSAEELSRECAGFLRRARELRYLDIRDVGRDPNAYLPSKQTLQAFVGDGEYLSYWISALGRQTQLRMISLNMAHGALSCERSPFGRVASLEELRIENARGIGDQCLHGLPAKLETLVVNAGRFDPSLAFLSGLSQLRSLELARGEMTEGSFAKLTELKRLKSLGLHYVRKGNRGLVEIGQMAGLERLELSGGEISRRSMAALVRLRNLRELTLIHTDLEDGSLKQLAELTQLRRVDLSKTPIGKEGLSVLGKLRHLKKLNLSGTGVQAGGLSGIAIENWTDLRTLIMNGSSVDKEAIVGLSKLPELRHLQIEYAQAWPTQCGTKAFPKLRKLYASKVQEKRKTFSCLTRLRGLEVLKLVDVGVDCEGIGALSKLERLQRVFLQDNPIGCKCAMFLASLPYLTEVWLPRLVSKNCVKQMRRKMENGGIHVGF